MPVQVNLSKLSKVKSRINHKVREYLEKVESPAIEKNIRDAIIFNDVAVGIDSDYRRLRDKLIREGKLHPMAHFNGLVFEGKLLDATRASVVHAIPPGSKNGVWIQIANDAPYARTHEFGEYVPPHEILLKGKGLDPSFYWMGGRVPRRPFFYPTIAEWKEGLPSRIADYLRWNL